MHPYNVVFCDDIRKEYNGKDILIGTYGGAVIVPAVPATVVLAFWIQIHLEGLGKCKGRVRIMDPAGNKAGEASFEHSIGHSVANSLNPDWPTALPLPPLPISIIFPGAITVQWAHEGEDFVEVGSKQVVIASSSTTGLRLPE